MTSWRLAPAWRTDRAYTPGELGSMCPTCGGQWMRADGQWIWRTQGDGRVRPLHADLEGTVWDDGDQHPTEGEPGDAWGCRCAKQLVVEASKARRERGAGPTKRKLAATDRAAVQALKRAQRKRDKQNATRRAASDRTDELELRIDSSGIVPTPEGYWIVQGVAGAEGVLDYPEYGGRREYRSEETLRRAAPTLVDKPITIQHQVRKVTPANYMDVTHGHVTAAWVEDGELRFEALIMSARAQQAIKSGLDKLSLSYRPVLVHTPGQAANGGKYDAEVVEMHFDNLTLTDRPRAGELAALRLDALPTMKTFTLTARGRTITLPELLLPGLTAAAQAERTDEDVPVGTIVTKKSDGSTMKLSITDGMIDDLMKMVGVGGEPEPEPAAPPVAPAGDAMLEEEELAARGDEDDEHKTDTLWRAREQLGAERRDIEAMARPVFGTRPMSHLDSAGILAAGIDLCRTDSQPDAGAATLARRARDPKAGAMSRGRALGQLTAKFEAAAKMRTDRITTEEGQRTDGSLGLSDFMGRLAETRPAGEQRTDTVGDARAAQIQRRTDRIVKQRKVG